MNFKKWAKDSLKLKYHWILLVVLVAPAVIYYCFGKLSGGPFSTFSFSENLLAEAYGLAATILVIERLLRHQRHLEWRPTRIMAYKKIISRIGNFADLLLFPWTYTLPNDAGVESFKLVSDLEIWAGEKIPTDFENALLTENLDRLDKIHNAMKSEVEGIEFLYSKYENSLLPEGRERLIEIEETADYYLNALKTYITYKNMFGSNEEQELLQGLKIKERDIASHTYQFLVLLFQSSNYFIDADKNY